MSIEEFLLWIVNAVFIVGLFFGVWFLHSFYWGYNGYSKKDKIDNEHRDNKS